MPLCPGLIVRLLPQAKKVTQTVGNRQFVLDPDLEIADGIVRRHWGGQHLAHLWHTIVQGALLASGAALYTHPPTSFRNNLELLAFVPQGRKAQFLQLALYVAEAPHES